MHPQSFDLVPHHLPGILVRGEIDEYLGYGTFFGFRVQKPVKPADPPVGNSEDVENRPKGKADDPPETEKKITHHSPDRVRLPLVQSSWWRSCSPEKQQRRSPQTENVEAEGRGSSVLQTVRPGRP